MRERLEERFRALDEVRAPERWPDLETFEPSGRSARRPGLTERWRKPVAALAALMIGAAGIGFAAWSFTRRDGPSQAAPIGGRIAFVSDRDGDGEIFLAGPTGGDLIRLTDNAFDERSPAWSPDGSRIAFVSERDGDAEIYVMDADGSQVQRLTRHPGDDTEPSWSPDSSRIAFTTDREGDPEIYTMNADGTGSANLTDSAGTEDWAPAWSPDGTRIAFIRVEPFERMDPRIPQVFVMDMRSGDVTRLTDVPSGATDPAWSPDGATIAFEGDGDIFVMDADGSGIVRLAADPPPGSVRGHPHPTYGNHAPAWTPDGRRIVFASDRGGDRDLYVMEADGDEADAVLVHAAPGADSDPALRPAPDRTPPTSGAPSPSPTPDDSPSPEPETAFRPATYREGDQTVMPVSFPDGTTAELVYPLNLKIPGPHGVVPYSSGYMPDNARDFWIFHGSVEEVVHRFQDPELLGEYPDGRGGIVTFWHFAEEPETNWLAFQFGDWTVLVYDYAPGSAGPPMTEEERRMWARTLLGHQTRDGFLVLEALPPLDLATAGDHAGPELQLDAHVAGVTLYAERCEPYDEQAGFDEEKLVRVGGLVVDRSQGFAAWCDPDTGINIHVTGSREFIDQVIEGLDIRNARYAS